ncbi:hypothetical protein [uncultured Roseobacter sp.]|uniref:hypothetical protein n=1 Tax=uncultured Roseobacter sp. TaxID=114847 RepID=UPI0026279CF8|nr:hypothetical protein [uncultured Roseobacter sp.]
METESDFPFFDVRQSVRKRNTTRLIIAPMMSAVLIASGLWLIPDKTILKVEIEAVETWSVQAFLGVVCIACGFCGMLRELLFAARSLGTSGEWHFRLKDGELLWHVPRHAHGSESGFSARLDELKEIEFRTIHQDEAQDKREYWVHFHARDPVQLQPYSGVSLSWLAENIRAAGVPYRETHRG